MKKIMCIGVNYDNKSFSLKDVESTLSDIHVLKILSFSKQTATVRPRNTTSNSVESVATRAVLKLAITKSLPETST